MSGAPRSQHPTASTVLAVGDVAGLARWPVKSLAGEQLRGAWLDERGFAGDRTHALVDAASRDRRPMTARGVPRMLLWSATYSGKADDRLEPARIPTPALRSPEGRCLSWSDPELPRALADDLGRPIALRRDLAGQQDVHRSILVTTEASRAALTAELGQPVDLRRFRANLHLALDAPAFAEDHWQGARLRVGELELEFLEPCRRCSVPSRDPDTSEKWGTLLRWIFDEHDGRFGIYARADRTAHIALGQHVSVVASRTNGTA